MLSVVAIMPVLLWAGYTDFKSRTISNKVGILLVVIAITEMLFFNQYFLISLAERLAVGFLFLFVFLFIYFTNSKISGGGDLKLLSATGFCTGFSMFYVLFFACITGLIYAFIKHQKGERIFNLSVPMGSCMAVGAFVFVAFNHVI